MSQRWDGARKCIGEAARRRRPAAAFADALENLVAEHVEKLTRYTFPDGVASAHHRVDGGCHRIVFGAKRKCIGPVLAIDLAKRARLPAKRRLAGRHLSLAIC